MDGCLSSGSSRIMIDIILSSGEQPFQYISKYTSQRLFHSQSAYQCIVFLSAFAKTSMLKYTEKKMYLCAYYTFGLLYTRQVS